MTKVSSSSVKKKKTTTAKAIRQNFDLFNLPDVLIPTTSKEKTTPIFLIKQGEFSDWIKKQKTAQVNQLQSQKFDASAGSYALNYDDDGRLERVVLGYKDKIGLYTICPLIDKIGSGKFHIANQNINSTEADDIVSGWLLACYRFTAFKKTTFQFPNLHIPKTCHADKAMGLARSIYMVRNLINLPPNALGPEALADAAVMIAKNFGAKSKVIVDDDLIKENYPMIYAVGDGSERRPRLIDFTWGNPKHPKVTLVGKGVCFDTGGYDLKPSSAMLLMKKDMGGAAMALGVAMLVMSHNLPIRLRVMIPAVENSVSGRAYRPSDILHSRQGLTVEIGNTDAEGRLVMADCLTAASEENPALIIDFSTLTGAARTALGFDIPALYSNRPELARSLQDLACNIGDPLWHMPLWDGYRQDVVSPNADLTNNSANPAGSITAALFLQHFVGGHIPWLHLDHYAWEAQGKQGRPRGGADTGMRAIFAYLEKEYG